MVTIGYSTRTTKPEFKDYLIKSSGFKKIEVIETVNNGEKSLAEVYNEIISESKTDIVILCHDDIYFDTTAWYSKIIKHFEKSDFGILGVAGTTSMPASGKWYPNSDCRWTFYCNTQEKNKKNFQPRIQRISLL